ncbi:MAG TPA: hypothetical protein PLF42_01790 [Anaerolineales bacterium]|nr:hypothetical protein [Anaerolineales bacterium]
MRVTRDSLLRIAKETVQERAYNDTDIIAAYLTGSLLTPDPMIGGTTDIDLVFVHKTAPMKRREFIKLTPDFHIDIARRAKDEFNSPRELRGDPWLGYEMYDPILLYEREKFFDFVQASLRAGFEFEQAPLMLQRCQNLLSHGRQIWMDIAELEQPAGPKEVRKYMKSLFHVVNCVAELSGPPLWDRRLLLEFPARAEAAQKPGMVAAVYGLIGEPCGRGNGQGLVVRLEAGVPIRLRNPGRGCSDSSRPPELLREIHQSPAGRGHASLFLVADPANLDIIRRRVDRRLPEILAGCLRQAGSARRQIPRACAGTRPLH